MPQVHFDHVALLVQDIDLAVADYRRILAGLMPDRALDVVWDEGEVDGSKVRWATFVSAAGETVIQLLQSDIPRDRRLLERRGECVHHLAFHSSDVKASVDALRRAGVEFTSETLTNPSGKPWLKWAFVAPGAAHGVLIEVAQRYRVLDGKWVPHQDD